MTTEHEEWLQHENARREAEHGHLMELMKHVQINKDQEIEERRRKNQASEAVKEEEAETDGKWTEPTDDDEYYE